MRKPGLYTQNIPVHIIIDTIDSVLYGVYSIYDIMVCVSPLAIV